VKKFMVIERKSLNEYFCINTQKVIISWILFIKLTVAQQILLIIKFNWFINFLKYEIKLVKPENFRVLSSIIGHEVVEVDKLLSACGLDFEKLSKFMLKIL